MDPDKGWRVFDHIRRTGARDVLDIGTAHGASAAYLAAAVRAGGGGTVTTIDRWAYEQPTPGEVFERIGVQDYVRTEVIEHSSYTWWLKERVEEQSDAHGNCSPLYDFCYLDGAHDWNIDGLAVVLIEKLLRPGGWLLLDDLPWSFESSGYTPVPEDLSAAERSQPPVQAVFDLILKQSPAFSEFRVQDEQWGWAKKAPGEPRRLRIESSRGWALRFVEWLPLPRGHGVWSRLRAARGRMRWRR